MEITRALLEHLYLEQKLSVAEISKKCKCSQSKINYWFKRFSISKRSITEATYIRLNPKGDPFLEQPTKTIQDSFLMGLGLGLYWGEGNKRNKHAVRLGNTDPDLIKTFLHFLRGRYDIGEHRLRYSLQIFSDMNVKEEERFWRNFLNAKQEQFYKTTVTRSGKVGSYKEKSAHGVLTLYFHNRKLQHLLLGEIERLRDLR